jgi:hypothetical protein
MSLTGGKRKANKSLMAWVKFVKKVQKEEKLSYKDAIHRAKVRKDKGEKWMVGGAYPEDGSMDSSVAPMDSSVAPMDSSMAPMASSMDSSMMRPSDEELLGGKSRRRTMRRGKGRTQQQKRQRGRTQRRQQRRGMGRASRRY